eukprot:142439_1
MDKYLADKYGQSKRPKKKKRKATRFVVDEDEHAVQHISRSPSPAPVIPVVSPVEQKEEQQEEEITQQIHIDDGSGWGSVRPDDGGMSLARPPGIARPPGVKIPKGGATLDDAEPSKPHESSEREAERQPKRRHDSDIEDSDTEVPRRDTVTKQSDPEPKTRRRHDSDIEDSDSDGDLSVPRRTRHDSSGSDSDLDVARRPTGEEAGISASRQSRLDSSGSDSDLEVARRPTEQPAQISSSKRHDSSDSDDLEVPRRKRESTPDLSPPRKQQPSRKSASSPPAKAFGLLSGREFGADVRAQQDHMRRGEKLDRTATGEGAATVRRDRKGRVITSEKEENPQKTDKSDEMEWAKGLAQKRKLKEDRRKFRHEQKKEFSRTADDEDMNKVLRAKSRWGDPMLQAIQDKKARKRQEKEQNDSENSADDISQKPKRKRRKREERPMCQHQPFVNRFNILPGYRWDGIDRSNKWEQKRFAIINERRALTREAYKWSSENM